MRDRPCKWNEPSHHFRSDCLHRRGRESRARGELDGALSFADGERSSAVVPARRGRWRQRTAAALSLRRHPRRRNFRPAVVAGNDPPARFFRRLRCDNVSHPQSGRPRPRRADESGRNRPQPRLPELQVTRNQGPLIAKLGPLEDRPEWPEAIYLTVHHTDVVYTIETPKPFPIKARVKAHIAAVETLMNALKG